MSACRGVTLAWFYLFLHTVLRYFYYQHMSLYNFFTSLNHASLPNASTVNAQFIFQFSSHSLTYWHPMRPLSKKNAENSLWEADYLFKKWTLWMWSLARMEQLNFQIKSRTSQQTWNRLRALKLCAIYPQLCMEFLTILGTTALMANSLRHTGQLQSLHHQNLAQNNIWYCPNFVCHFLFHFLRTNFGIHSDKTLVDLLTFKCKELILFYELACATVIQPKAGVLNLLLCHGTLWVWWKLLTLLTKMYLNT